MQTTPAKTALHNRLHPAHSPGRSTLGKSPEQQILNTIGGNFDEKTVRTKFVQMLLAQPGIIGACFLIRNANEIWEPSIKYPLAGKLPARNLFDEALAVKCDEFAKSSTVQFEHFATDDRGGPLAGTFAAIRPRGAEPELLLVTTDSKANGLRSAALLQRVVSAIQIWLSGRSAADSDWQVIALASVIELIGKIEKQPTTKAACEETVNTLANRIGCDAVAIGLVERGRMQLKAISGVAKLDRGSKPSQLYLQTLLESATRKTTGLYPAIDDQNNYLLQAHKQLAATTQVESVRSLVLTGEDDQILGAIVFTGAKRLLESSQVARFCDTSIPPVASALQVVSKVKQGVVTRTRSFIRRKLPRTKQIAILGCLGVGIAMMFLPITYRVRCDCLVEADSRRFAVAPFQGQILTGHCEAGDYVKAGDVLAEMDGRTVRWELAGVTAEREQSVRTREIELFDRNVPKTILAELENERLVSQESVLKYKRDHLLIKSPVDGVVLSGSLERAEAASVETGQVLFEIGPLSPVQIEVAIPDDEIEHVQQGSQVKAWIDGQEDDPIEGSITKIHPRSETRNGDNVFVAEVQFDNSEERLRPGMKGSARIDSQQRPLGWCLFHKPYYWVQSRLTWW